MIFRFRKLAKQIRTSEIVDEQLTNRDVGIPGVGSGNGDGQCLKISGWLAGAHVLKTLK